MFTCIQPCSPRQCTLVGSTPLSLQGTGAIRFNSGSYVDSHGQRHPLDIKIPIVYYVSESTMNLLSTTHLRYNIHLNSQCGPNVIFIRGLPSQVSGVWGIWYQGYIVGMVTRPYTSTWGRVNLCCEPSLSMMGKPRPLSQLR